MALDTIIGNATEKRGLQIGIFPEAEYLNGVQLGFINGGDFEGIQVGFINFSSEFKGIQLGFINDVHPEGPFDPVSNYKGAQIGFVNITEEAYGVQLGVFNSIGGGKNIQIGLLNKNPSNPWYRRYFPIINWGNSKIDWATRKSKYD